ncbi:hypothetical protein ACFQ6N_30190 [Kitasatospora sp. NPDC056446]|uniref:hypothetical protein n=1 Tax=Kitasatospora sp. NPDC056446 TaxID=3345819 RepID=UPI00367D121A
MIGIIVFAVVGLVLLFPVVMTRLAKRKLAQLERAKATIAGHEARVAAEERKKNTIYPTDHGLLLGKDLVRSDEPGPEEEAALTAAKAGDWRPAAAFLAGEGTADLRWRRMYGLTDLAAEDDTWLRAWRAERPQDPTAALLHANALISVAWNIRSSARATEVSSEQFAGFHRVLGEAEEAFAEAVALAPADDPNPWVARIPIAMGLGWSNDRFRQHWAELTERDPHHWGAHSRALQYWCAKWRGSHELMHGFIDGAVAAAPAGSLLAPMRLEAYFEQFARDREKTTAWQRPEVGAALDAALADLAATDPEHPRVVYTRGWLAYGLTRAGRPTEALEQFQALGRFIPPPFTNFNDPRQSFIDLRVDAVQGAVAAKEAAKEAAQQA